jgi:hypothetical protein
MRNLIVSIACALALVAACGPSGREVAVAKTARYQGDKLTLFAGAKTATEGKHPLDQSDETTLTIVTKGRWFTPEGLVSNWKPGDQKDGKDRLDDRSLNISLVVRLLPEGDKWVVLVEPVILEFRQGQGNLNPLKPNDPALPGWATGKVDQLAYEIYTALRPYEVKGVGGIAPAPEPTPAVAPAPAATEPAPAPDPSADPAAGSAAPQ